MPGKIKISRNGMTFVMLAVFAIGFIAGSTLPAEAPKYEPANIQEERAVNMLLPAVDSEGNGVVANLSTTVKPGSGKILVDTSSLLNYPDTQLSGRIAAKVASDYAKVNLSNVDITYVIIANASMIEGPSAGASMAVSVLLALNNKTNGHVAITGTINPDGTIGRVGAVLEKARSAKEHGIEIFLVPEGQINSEDSKKTRTCSTVGGMEICRITYQSKTVDIGKIVNMTVYEVSNIGEAAGDFVNITV